MERCRRAGSIAIRVVQLECLAQQGLRLLGEDLVVDLGPVGDLLVDERRDGVGRGLVGEYENDRAVAFDRSAGLLDQPVGDPPISSLPDECSDSRAGCDRGHQGCRDDPDEQSEPAALDGALGRRSRSAGLVNLHLPVVALVDHGDVLDGDLACFGRRVDPVQHPKAVVA